MRSLRRLLLAAVLVIAAGYAAGAAWLMWQETTLVFRAGRPLGSARPAQPFEQMELPRADGARQFAWIMRQADGNAAAWILYLHGNDATVASRMNILHYELLRSLGLNVLAPEYRGYGGLDGVPSEAGLSADARAAYDYLREHLGVEPERLAIYGWSLGGAVAVDLASQVAHAGLILEGAPASIAAIGQDMYPLFPVRLIMRNPFEAVLKIGRVRAPILFLHSRDDAIVPVGEARRLFDTATAPKRFVELRGGHVNAIRVDGETAIGAIGELLESIGLRSVETAGSPREQRGHDGGQGGDVEADDPGKLTRDSGVEPVDAAIDGSRRVDLSVCPTPRRSATRQAGLKACATAGAVARATAAVAQTFRSAPRRDRSGTHQAGRPEGLRYGWCSRPRGESRSADL